MKTSTKVWLWILGIGIIFGIFGLIFKTVLLPSYAANKTVDTGYGIVDKTMNADNALFNYEQFYDLYQGAKQQVMNINNCQKQIDNLKKTYGEDSSKWTKDIRNDLAFQQQTIEGYLMQYQKIISEYNSNSQKLNRNLFKAKELPYELPLNYKELVIY